MGIFFLGIPFPLLILAAAMIGFAGTRAGLPHFQTGEPKAREGGPCASAWEALPLPCPPGTRAHPARCRILALLWLVPVLSLVLALGQITCSAKLPSSSQRWPW